MIDNSPPFSPVVSDSCKDCLCRMLEKNPGDRVTIRQLKTHSWISKNGSEPMLDTEQNCPHGMIEINDDDIKNSIRTIPKIETLVSGQFLELKGIISEK